MMTMPPMVGVPLLVQVRLDAVGPDLLAEFALAQTVMTGRVPSSATIIEIAPEAGWSSLVNLREQAVRHFPQAGRLRCLH